MTPSRHRDIWIVDVVAHTDSSSLVLLVFQALLLKTSKNLLLLLKSALLVVLARRLLGAFHCTPIGALIQLLFGIRKRRLDAPENGFGHGCGGTLCRSNPWGAHIDDTRRLPGCVTHGDRHGQWLQANKPPEPLLVEEVCL